MNNRFLSAKIMIESLRDNGYSNTAHAVAELIDNSLQATATRVEIGFVESQRSTAGRRIPYTVSEISIWDNGLGMDAETLRVAMQFGGGTHRNDSSGMGKFGMGLPNSSISQCKRVEVWSWQESGAPYFTYLDVDEMKQGDLDDVPEPVVKEIPEHYQKAFFIGQPPKSGTLVIWSKLDRLTWKTGQSIFRHCELLVGRMYRNFMCDQGIKIESITYRQSGKDKLDVWKKDTFRANDPMYLKKGTSLPELPGSYKNEAFFEMLDREVISVEYEDASGVLKKSDVTVTSSIVKTPISNKLINPIAGMLGATKWGKHCGKNIGVSIVRAGRELVLRDSFLSSALRESKGRFMGIEVSFEPCLDNVFGVTNNKQDAVRLIPYDMAALVSQSGFDAEQEYLRDLEENDDSLLQVLKVVSVIKKLVNATTKSLLDVNTKGKVIKGSLDAPNSSAEAAADKATQGSSHRERHGHKTETIVDDLKKDDVVKHLIDEGVMTKEEAEKKAERLILTGNRFLIEDVSRDSEAFFDVSTSKGLTLVLFNTNHIFHEKLVSKLGPEELEVLQVTIAGFARVMNETTDDKRLKYLNRIRKEWGLVISEFLEDPSDEGGDDF